MASKTYRFGYDVTIIPAPPAWQPTDVFIVAEYAESHSWSSGTRYTSASVGNLSMNVSPASRNNGNYYDTTSGKKWNIGSTAGAHITLSAPSGKKITSYRITYASQPTANNYHLHLGSSSGTVIESETVYTNDSSNFSLYAGGSSENCRISSIEVVIE